MKVKKLFSAILIITLSGLIFFALNNCKKNSDDTNENPATVTTDSVTDIGKTTAIGGGNVTSAGSSSVTAKGVCWSTSPNPTISSPYTSNGTGTGSFTSSLTGLTAKTPYYVRAYATNSAGTAYGNQITFTTSETGTLPAVTTKSITNISQTTATGGGNVTSDGGATVTARGVCYSTHSNPTITDLHTTDGTGTGSFTSNLTGLTANTPYYVRAYATNSAGTAYGNQVTFTTSGEGPSGESCPGIPTITDPRDGQVYPTVQIGSQCWLQKNMNYQTGNSWCYDNNTANCNTYGRLYEWNTAIGVCPSGWHLPSDAEWCTITQFIDPTVNCNTTGWSGIDAGTKMKSTSGWNSGGNGTNASGFTALPGGGRLYNGNFFGLTSTATFWSSSDYSSPNAWYRGLYYNNASMNRNASYKSHGFSVRCVRD